MMRDDEFERLLAMLRQEPLRFDTGGGTFDGFSGDFGGSDTGPGGTNVADEQTGSYSSSTGQVNTALNEMQLLDRELNEIGKHDLSTAAGLAAAAPALGRLQSAGYGDLTGLYANNPTSSIDNLLASQNFGTNIAPALVAMMPGSGLIKGAQFAQDLVSGKISPGQAITQGGLAIVAGQLNVSPATLTNMLEGKYGQAVASAVGGKVAGAIAQATDLPGGLVSLGLNVSGAGKALNDNIASAVNNVISSSPTNAVGQIASSIDSVLGASGGAGPSMAGTSVVPTGDTTGADSAGEGTSALSMLAALGAAGLQSGDDEDSEESRIARVQTVSPFGSAPYTG